MSAGTDRIRQIRIVPVAFGDKPLLNISGVHAPFALRAVVIVQTDGGLQGLGETYGDARHVERLQRAADRLVGQDVFALHRIRALVAEALSSDSALGGHGMSGMVTGSSTVDRVFSPFEVACLDLQGKVLGRPVADLLGGTVRDRVPFTGYLFYKWAGFPGQPDDEWGEALTPDQLVEQAHRMIDGYGFTALKLKGGVFPPEQEAAAILALREEFPDLPLRLDPNGAWTVQSSLRVAERLDGVVEYLEDPTVGLDALAEVAQQATMPLATNMYVVAFDHLPEAVRRGSVQVVLSDHHFWGGLRRSAHLGEICQTFGLGLSMHSNSHLGISLAAMIQLAAATPNLTYACDTHWPWKADDEDVVDTSHLQFVDGSIAVPDAPGLGVTLDEDKLERLHRQYLECGLTERDDTAYMRTIQPDFDPTIPRW